MITFVGEITNPPEISERFALTGASGRRMTALAGVDWTVWLRQARLNLCPMEWDDDLARVNATLILRRSDPGDVVVMLGRRVCIAFNQENLRWYDRVTTADGVILLAFPHPSPRSRYWNDYAHVRQAEVALRELMAVEA